jgi:sugar phosphate isomerase/epimerase
VQTIRDRFVASPCCTPKLALDKQLDAYARLGFRKYEAFTTWVEAAIDIEGDPEFYRRAFSERDMRVTSFHLPAVEDASGSTFERAVRAAQFAEELGVEIVLFKATDRAAYLRAAPEFLELTDSLKVQPVLQNHAGSPITTLEDYRSVLEGIDDDRVGAILEVGHFHAVGVDWWEGCELLGDKISLVHIKDQVGAESVPYGEGEINLANLFRHLNHERYTGDFVLEMEVPDATDEQTLAYLGDAMEYLDYCQHQ